MDSHSLLDPEFGISLVKLFSWILVALGVFKVVIYLVGEFAPGTFARVKSDAVRKFLTGRGNRLLFGLGGFLTALVGLGGLLAARFLAWSLERGFL